MPNMDLHEVLAKYQVSANKLADYSGVNASQLSRILSGKQRLSSNMEAYLKVGLRRMIRERAQRYALAMGSVVDDGVPLTDRDRIEIREFIVPTLPDLGGEFVEIGQQTADADRKEQPEVEIID